MPVKTTLNATNLKALGAERLAALLIEISEGNATAKRRLRLELAGAGNPAAVGREVRKRLTAIGRSQSYVDWQKRKTLATDLTAQRRAIVGQVSTTDACDALDLMWCCEHGRPIPDRRAARPRDIPFSSCRARGPAPGP